MGQHSAKLTRAGLGLIPLIVMHGALTFLPVRRDLAFHRSAVTLMDYDTYLKPGDGYYQTDRCAVAGRCLGLAV